MDSDSNYAIYIRTFTTALAALHLCLTPLFKISYGYAPVLFACFLSIALPYFLLAIKVKKLLKKEDFQVHSRILRFLTRNRFITWNDIHFSIDIFLASANFFAVYTNIAIRIRQNADFIYYLIPAGLSFILCCLFFLDASFAFHSMKYTVKPIIRSTNTRLDKIMNFLAERMILVQFPILILVIIWRSAEENTPEEKVMYAISIYAAYLIQYPLIFMMIIFFHGRAVRWANGKLGEHGLHVYGIQYTLLLIISGLSLPSLVLNIELILGYRDIVYIIAPYATFVISMTQACALAGHEAWKNFGYPHEEKRSVVELNETSSVYENIDMDRRAEDVRTRSPENSSSGSEFRVEEIREC